MIKQIIREIFIAFIILFTVLVSEMSAKDSSAVNNILSPPIKDGITKVFLSIIINNISEVNASSQVIKADILMTARWNDPRLVHTESGGRIERPENIWGPFLTFSNRLNITKSFPEQVTILEDGTVYYIQRIFGDFSQNLHFKEFPFDIQNFELKVIDLSFNADEILLVPDPEINSGIGNSISLNDWEFEKWKIENSTFTILEGNREVPSIIFTISAKRVSGFYILIFVIPLLLIIMMSWIVFWLPPNLSASQISVATTSMLTLIAYRFIVTSYLPRISYLTRMDIFILGSSILIFMTLVLAALSSNITAGGRGELARKYDKRFRWIFPLLYMIVIIVALTA